MKISLEEEESSHIMSKDIMVILNELNKKVKINKQEIYQYCRKWKLDDKLYIIKASLLCRLICEWLITIVTSQSDWTGTPDIYKLSIEVSAFGYNLLAII